MWSRLVCFCGDVQVFVSSRYPACRNREPLDRVAIYCFAKANNQSQKLIYFNVKLFVLFGAGAVIRFPLPIRRSSIALTYISELVTRQISLSND
jgi:hypothetical protein